ncbi:hypothetical protein ThidrDRAFT_4511 [Thiorhodococcus drewsii AZ1]|uniref:Uncharacterized protein n=1 Tax=Thiorhodococcus drewsii AZ1 TaxID=765913 RepID=G2E897_9GAMM|nr:hypothetical protein [Thiorhodococcus drewsii]EGV27677.1 hypothetical protein ThidrDRAFT_4511 [Thiorhodococcus drewsii AZ1]
MSDPRSTDAPELAPSSRSAVLPPIQAHSCFLFYPLQGAEFSKAPAQCLGDLRSAPSETSDHPNAGGWLADDMLQTIDGKRVDWPVWEPATLSLGNDLHPHVQRLVGGREPTGTATLDPSLGNHAQVFRLTEGARKLVAGKRLAYEPAMPKEMRRPHRLMLELSSTAHERIQRQVSDWSERPVEVAVLDLHYIVFRTGFAFLIAEVRFGGEEGVLAPEVLNEALYSLARINRLTWWRADGTALDASPAFSLATLARGLIGKPAGGRAERVFTATYLQFETRPDAAELERLLVRLSRHYTADYHLRDALPGTERVTHFENVTHVFTLEGCASAVDLGGYPSGAAPEFLQNYLSVTYRGHYLPIVLLAHHEFCFLLHLTNDASFWPDPARFAADRERMIAMRQDIANFRLCFSFSYVSRISMHNAVNAALRRALGLDAMLSELGRDTAEIDALLERTAAREAATRAHRNERRFRWASVIGVFGITWLTTHTLFKEALELPLMHALLHLGHDQVGLVAGGIALIVSLVAAILTGVRGSADHGHLAQHAVQDNVIHQAGH